MFAPSALPTQTARVQTLHYEAQGIISIVLHPVGRSFFAPFTAGAHIELHLPNGLRRCYSLINDANETHRYVIAVQLEEASRGGSRYLHEQLRVGMELPVSEPRQHFPLDESAPHTVLVAGVIGIAPLYCMLQRLVELGRSVELIYCAPSRARMAFFTAIRDLKVKTVWYLDDQQGFQPPNLTRLMMDRSADAHFYGCGPLPMLAAFQRACELNEYPNIHIESFAPLGGERAMFEPQPFTVLLAKSGKTLTVPADEPLLDVLLANQVPVPYTCRAGVCGVCRVPVQSGAIAHADAVLSSADRADGNVMLCCVSRAQHVAEGQAHLVLDL